MSLQFQISVFNLETDNLADFFSECMQVYNPFVVYGLPGTCVSYKPQEQEPEQDMEGTLRPTLRWPRGSPFMKN